MVYQYFRKIEDVENDIKNAMQISSILLKLKGYDDDIEKIDTNENNIADNLEKIDDNENNISNNLEKIDNISQFILKSDKDFEKTYNIESQRFEFNKTNHFFSILEKEIEHDFIKNTLLFIKNNIYYKYDDLEDDYHRCQHEYNIYDNENNLIHKYLFNKDTYYDENSDILNTNEEFCIFLKQDYNKIKIVLELHRHNRHGFGNINLEIVDDNENYIKIEYIERGFLGNSHLVNLNTGSISTNSGKIDKNTSSISSNKDLIDTNTSSISTNSTLIKTNTSSISSNKDLIEKNTSDNLEKINHIENELRTIIDIYNETFIISNRTILSKSELIFNKIINFNFSKGGFFNILTTCNYDTKYNFDHTYYFYNNNNLRLLKKEIIPDNIVSNVVKHEFSFESFDISSLKILIIYTSDNNETVKLFGNNSFQFKYNEINFKMNNIKKNSGNISSNKDLIDTNASDILDNLGKINTNTSSISTNLEKINKINELNKNIKAFYNLDQIFIYDIEKGNQTVNKDNHFHIFEKEIKYNFIKNSYLEIALKVLTEISNYVLIGFFQILCNFYDQDNNLFYTISLSTAAGSINKLSTIKSVFIVPINENMSKIKIDFFIAPKETQQNRSAKFVIQDINSNKIYIKYFQKTEEMSIKDIQDALDNGKNISEQVNDNKDNIASNLGKINNISKTIMLKNIYFTDFESKINDTIIKELIRFDIENNGDRFTDLHKVIMKYYFKKDDIIEIDCKLLISHTTYDYANNISLLYALYEGTEVNNKKLLFKEIRRYNQFALVDSKDRVLAYTKLLYKVEYDMDNILFYIQIGAPNQKKMDLILSHVILEGKINYISIKHYGN